MLATLVRRLAREVAIVAPHEDPARETDYAMDLAASSYQWYKRAAIHARKGYKTSETLIVIVAAAIPTSVVVAPDNTIAPAVLGAFIVVLTGLRAIFHWQDNYLRFSGAREAVEAQRRLYMTQSSPYDDAATRHQVLTAAVTTIEQDEMRGWVDVAAKPPLP